MNPKELRDHREKIIVSVFEYPKDSLLNLFQKTSEIFSLKKKGIGK